MSSPVNGQPVDPQAPNPFTPREGEATQVANAYIAQGEQAHPVQPHEAAETQAAMQAATQHIGSQPTQPAPAAYGTEGYASPEALQAVRGQQVVGQPAPTQPVATQQTVTQGAAPVARPTQGAPVDGATATLSPEDESYLRYRQEDRSLGEIASDVMSNATTLVKQEVELAKAETKQSITRASKGIGLLAGAAVAGLMTLFALTLMLWWVIAVLLGGYDHPSLGWSGLIVTVLWAIVAGVLALLGKQALDKIKGLPKTVETVSKIPNAVAGNEEKNR